MKFDKILPSRRIIPHDLDKLDWMVRQCESSLDAVPWRAARRDALCISGLSPVVASRTSVRTPELLSRPKPLLGMERVAAVPQDPNASQRIPTYNISSIRETRLHSKVSSAEQKGCEKHVRLCLPVSSTLTRYSRRANNSAMAATTVVCPHSMTRDPTLRTWEIEINIVENLIRLAIRISNSIITRAKLACGIWPRHRWTWDWEALSGVDNRYPVHEPTRCNPWSPAHRHCSRTKRRRTPTRT